MKKQHVQGRPNDEPEAGPPDPEELEKQEEERSLDLVQRMVVSALAFVIGGSISAWLLAYITLNPADLDQASIIALWLVGGVAGLLTAATILVINRRHPYSPLVVLGLAPMAISAYWVFP